MSQLNAPRETDQPIRSIAMDWQWQIDFFHVHGMDGASTSLLSLKNRDGGVKRARGEGQTPLHALLDALGRITGRDYALRSAKIYAAKNSTGSRARAHIVLVDEESRGHAGFGLAENEHDAFLIAALRIVNSAEAERQSDALIEARGFAECGWRKTRRAPARLAA